MSFMDRCQWCECYGPITNDGVCEHCALEKAEERDALWDFIYLFAMLFATGLLILFIYKLIFG